MTPPWRLSDYEHFRPFLASKTLRFSYGVPKFRPRGRWQSEAEQMKPLGMVRRLEELGFAGLYLNRRGFEDRAEALLSALASAGYKRMIQSPLGSQVVVALNPVAHPELPFAQGLTAGRGWEKRAVEGVRWAQGPASLLYFNPRAEPVKVRISLRLEVPRSQTLALMQTGRELGGISVSPGRAVLTVEGVELVPGLNTFLLTGGEAKRDAKGAASLRMVGMTASAVSLWSDGAPPMPAGEGEN